MQSTNADELLESFNETLMNTVTQTTYKMYQSRYNKYIKTISTIQGSDPPEPVTSLNLKLYLEYRKQNGKTFNSICADISAIGYFCRANNFFDVTTESFVSQFKKGTKRLLKAGTNPNAKIPLTKEELKLIIQKSDLSKLKNLQICAHSIIQYFGVLRVSEVANLKNVDFNFKEDHVIIHISYTKTDQTGVGRNITIYTDSDITNNITIIKSLHRPENPYSFYFISNKGNPLTVDTLRRRFKIMLYQLGIDTKNKSTHSLRKGGAHRLALNHTEINAIKYQGGWKSPVFLKYTEFNEKDTSEEIKGKFK